MSVETKAEITQLPRWLECWETKGEKAQRESGIVPERERWLNRPTFILAAIGSAVGLGNFWRFPYLTYKYDGAAFFFPYLSCLFTLGIPLLLMELSLGQKFQRGDISVFRGIHRRLAGIGLASVFSAYIICFYYNVIISWSLVYLIAGFKSPLPWSEDIKNFEWKCTEGKHTRAEQFFMIDVIRYYGDDCEKYEDGDPTQFSMYAFGATFVVWFFCFIAVFKGVHSASYLVWFTVPVPLCFIVILVINGSTLEGAGKGVNKYLNGPSDLEKFGKDEATGEMVTGDALIKAQAAYVLKQSGVWGDAAGQIFFSIGVCMGIMTSYGSYNHTRKPIIMDNMIICMSNSTVSFVSGFAVWTVVGFLEAKDSLAKSKTSSIGLAFIAYPTACDMMPAKNLWAIMLGATLFLLGIDSAFSMVEATSTVICDTPAGSKIPRMFIAFFLCFLGFLLSIPFCTNWGFVLFDVIDHYLCVFLLQLVGILQCAGVGWGFDAELMMSKSENHAKAIKFLTIAYWFFLIVVGTIFCVIQMKVVGLLVFFGILVILLGISKHLSQLDFKTWFEDVMMTGVKKISYSMTCLGRKDPLTRESWETVFMCYWGFAIKYFVPAVLWFILISTFIKDVTSDTLYGDYAFGWQIAGICVPCFGLFSFLGGLVFFVQDEPYDERQFDEYFIASQPEQNKVADLPTVVKEQEQNAAEPME